MEVIIAGYVISIPTPALVVNSNGKVAIKKPRNIDPESPKNILAGVLLYMRNPNIEKIIMIQIFDGKSVWSL